VTFTAGGQGQGQRLCSNVKHFPQEWLLFTHENVGVPVKV